MMALSLSYLDPLSPYQLKKIVIVGSPMTKLSGSAHGEYDQELPQSHTAYQPTLFGVTVCN